MRFRNALSAAFVDTVQLAKCWRDLLELIRQETQQPVYRHRDYKPLLDFSIVCGETGEPCPAIEGMTLHVGPGGVGWWSVNATVTNQTVGPPGVMSSVGLEMVHTCDPMKDGIPGPCGQHSAEFSLGPNVAITVAFPVALYSGEPWGEHQLSVTSHVGPLMGDTQVRSFRVEPFPDVVANLLGEARVEA